VAQVVALAAPAVHLVELQVLQVLRPAPTAAKVPVLLLALVTDRAAARAPTEKVVQVLELPRVLRLQPSVVWRSVVGKAATAAVVRHLCRVRPTRCPRVSPTWAVM
jgi:hypothetical protein